MTALPIRTRITAAFAVATAVLLLAVGLFVYVRTGSDLLDAVDAGLRSRADVVASEVRAAGPAVAMIEPNLIEADEAFVQIGDGSGSVVRSSRIVAERPLLSPETLRGL